MREGSNLVSVLGWLPGRFNVFGISHKLGTRKRANKLTKPNSQDIGCVFLRESKWQCQRGPCCAGTLEMCSKNSRAPIQELEGTLLSTYILLSKQMMLARKPWILRMCFFILSHDIM